MFCLSRLLTSFSVFLVVSLQRDDSYMTVENDISVFLEFQTNNNNKVFIHLFDNSIVYSNIILV